MNQHNLGQAIPYIIIGVLGLLLFQRSCRELEPVKKPDTIYSKMDPAQPVIITVPVTQPYIINQPSPQQLGSVKIDTMAIIRDFLSQVQYQDTVRSDTADIYLKETVERNRITSRTVGYVIKKPFLTVINHPPLQRRNQYYLGLFAAGGSLELGPTATLITKKDIAIQIGYDPFTKFKMVGAQFKIR